MNQIGMMNPYKRKYQTISSLIFTFSLAINFPESIAVVTMTIPRTPIISIVLKLKVKIDRSGSSKRKFQPTAL